MSRYKIVFARSARKELQALPLQIAGRIIEKVETLADNPRTPGNKKLRGQSGLRRIRVGQYRVIYSIDDDNLVVDISVIHHRSEAYR